MRALPEPLRHASGLAMLASVCAHGIFFTGVGLLSPPSEAQPEKLRVVSLLPPSRNSLQSPPPNPNAPLQVPTLPPPGVSSLQGLPSLRPDQPAQSYRVPGNRAANPRRGPTNPRQQSPAQRSRTPQRSPSGATFQSDTLDKLNRQPQSRDQSPRVKDPLNNSDVAWGRNLSSTPPKVNPNQSLPPGAAGKCVDPTQEPCTLKAPNDPKRQAFRGSTGAPASGPETPAPTQADVDNARKELNSYKNLVVARAKWFEAIYRDNGLKKVDSATIPLKPAYPPTACSGQFSGEIQLGKYVTAEGVPRNLNWFDSPDHEPLRYAMLQAVLEHEQNPAVKEAQQGKALIYTAEFKYPNEVCTAQAPTAPESGSDTDKKPAEAQPSGTATPPNGSQPDKEKPADDKPKADKKEDAKETPKPAAPTSKPGETKPTVPKPGDAPKPAPASGAPAKSDKAPPKPAAGAPANKPPVTGETKPDDKPSPKASGEKETDDSPSPTGGAEALDGTSPSGTAQPPASQPSASEEDTPKPAAAETDTPPKN